MTPNKRFVIDTNTLISSAIIANSTSFRALDKARTEGAIIFSEETFLEFELVLFRKKFDHYFSLEERLQIIQKTYASALILPVISDIQICRDQKDNKFLNLAFDAEAVCIITGDQDLLSLHPFNNISIISASDFLMNY